MGPTIVCVGDLLLDIVVRESAVEGRETVVVESGGSAANAAAWLVWCGLPATLIAAVGADTAAEVLDRELRARGVVPALQVHPQARSGAFVARATGDSYSPLATERGANDLLAWGSAEDVLVHGAAHLHLSGYSLAHPVSSAACLAAAAAARRGGVTISLDLGAPHALHAAGPELGSILAEVAPTVLFANVDEARTLESLVGEGTGMGGGDSDGDDLVCGLLRFTSLAVLKEGAQGSRATSSEWGGEVLRQPAPRVTFSDAIGAGDAFVAGFLSAWLTSDTAEGGRQALSRALGRGTTAAAQCLERPGGRPPPL